MILIPSIDLKDGSVMRFVRGVDDALFVSSMLPGAQARLFVEQGFKWLHVVDLNGATTGEMVNTRAVEDILATVDIPVQLGGGIRDMKRVEFWLSRGVSRVILGTVALRNPSLVREACRAFPGRVCVSIDAAGGRVALSGWTESTNVTALEVALRFEDAGVAAIIHTDIGIHRTDAGINVDAVADLAFALTTPLIASGGLASLGDIRQLRKHETAGVVGVVCGRALHDGRVNPHDALAVAGEQTTKL